MPLTTLLLCALPLPLPQAPDLTYASSVDGTPLTSRLHLPPGHDPAGAPVPLVVHLHGAGGNGRLSFAMRSELDARGWIGVAPDGRPWGTPGTTCPWPNSPAYYNSPDPTVGPCEQDVFDLIDVAVATLGADPDRVYLTGFSYGGRGTYIIGLKNPDRFAALAPMGPPTDMYEIDVRRPDSDGCRLAVLGGVPGDSPEIDTRFTVTSARFLLENAYNLPVFHAHGLLDDVTSNDPAVAPYLHGWHVTVDTSWDACHGTTDLCFGHTPTLSELRARHPDGYDFGYMFTSVGHISDPRWLRGMLAGPGRFGVPDPAAPARLLGVFDFFEAHTRVTSPETVVFKTYEDEHRRAYWLELETSAPWTDEPAAVRARRNVAANALDLEVVRARAVRIDLAAAGLDLSVEAPLGLTLAPLAEPTYDPALTGPQGPLEVTLACPTDVVGATVTVAGVALGPDQVTLAGAELAIGPLDVSSALTLVVEPAVQTCAGAPNSAGAGATLEVRGTTSIGRADMTLALAGAPAGATTVFFYGFGPAAAPLGDGTLCIAPPLFRLPGVQFAGAGGEAHVALDPGAPPLVAGAGAVAAGTRARFQGWFRDVSSPSGSNLSATAEVRFLP